MKKSGMGGKRPTPVFGGPKESQDNKSRSVRHENRLAKELGSRTTPNSGALPFIGDKGDLQDDLFVWQAKLTKGSNLSLGSKVLLEVCRQASQLGKIPALALTMEGLPDHLEKDWVCLPTHIFKEMRDSYEDS